VARLAIKSPGFDSQTIELHLGVNSFGRGEENDWQIVHATVSTRHCEVELEAAGVWLRDCGSTNGTFLNGDQVTEAPLAAGQTLRMGDIEMLVENVEVKIAIPAFETVPEPEPPKLTPRGEMCCANHPSAVVTHRCVVCNIMMCETCVHHLRRRGGKALLLCPVCSTPVEPLGVEVKKKKTFMEYLRTTVRLPFFHPSNRK
jgi:pSer/pThr/pTyr-binding forkhead associated (FHA) protein